MERGENVIDTENSTEHDSPQTLHGGGAVRPLPDGESAEDDMPQVAAPAGE